MSDEQANPARMTTEEIAKAPPAVQAQAFALFINQVFLPIIRSFRGTLCTIIECPWLNPFARETLHRIHRMAVMIETLFIEAVDAQREGKVSRRSFRQLAEARQEEWDSHLSPETKALLARPSPITLAEYTNARMNSWERESIMPKLDNEALMHVTEHYLNNCQYDKTRPASVYDDALLGVVLPEIIKRWKEDRL